MTDGRTKKEADVSSPQGWPGDHQPAATLGEVCAAARGKECAVGEDCTVARGSPRPALCGRSSPPSAAPPDPPFAGNRAAARGEDCAAARGSPRPAERGRLRAFGGVLIIYEGMSWTPVPAPRQYSPVPASPGPVPPVPASPGPVPPMPMLTERPQESALPERPQGSVLPERPPVPAPHKCPPVPANRKFCCQIQNLLSLDHFKTVIRQMETDSTICNCF